MAKQSLSQKIANLDPLAALDLDIARRKAQVTVSPINIDKPAFKGQEWIPESLCYCYSHILCLHCNRTSEISHGWKVESKNKKTGAWRYTIVTSSSMETLERTAHFLGTEQVQICPSCAIEQVERKPS